MLAGRLKLLVFASFTVAALAISFMYFGHGSNYSRVELDPWCGSTEIAHIRTLKEHNSITIENLYSSGVNGQIVLFAHRGGYMCEEYFQAPENSIANVFKAIELGFDGYEADVWSTRDGKFVIFHDSQLARRSNGSGSITDHTLEELNTLYLKFPSGRLSEEKIPSLEHFLSAGQGRILFLLQIKENVADDFPLIQQVVEDAGAVENTLYWIKATKNNVDSFRRLIESGVDGIRKSVVWRVDSLENLDYVVKEIRPRIVDFPPNFPEGWSQETVNQLFPRDHFELVLRGLEYPIIPMVSRIRTEAYMGLLYSEGIRIFVSKKAELQLHQSIAKGLHY